MTEAAESRRELLARLNSETGKLPWSELERHFARGVVVKVKPGLDLVEVAAAIVDDKLQLVEAWMKAGDIAHARMNDAKVWHEQNPLFWSIVTAPWVLVQEITEEPK